MNLIYLIPRVIRHFLPEKLTRVLLLRNFIIHAGVETSRPAAAVQRYTAILSEHGFSFDGKRVLIFGYGGRFDIGFEVLKEGAAHVVLCDKFAPPDETHNQRMFAAEEKYFLSDRRGLRPRSEWMTLLEADIREVAASHELESVDIVLSSSVYEHLDDVEGITGALANLTKSNGIQIHFVDLRDHFFKYPFEMLRFSDQVWRNWLNPSSNHNRYRLWNYREAFEACFERVEIEILSREEKAFHRLVPYIRSEFISGNLVADSAATIRVIASKPLKGG